MYKLRPTILLLALLHGITTPVHAGEPANLHGEGVAVDISGVKPTNSEIRRFISRESIILYEGESMSTRLPVKTSTIYVGKEDIIRSTVKGKNAIITALQRGVTSVLFLDSQGNILQERQVIVTSIAAYINGLIHEKTDSKVFLNKSIDGEREEIDVVSPTLQASLETQKKTGPLFSANRDLNVNYHVGDNDSIKIVLAILEIDNRELLNSVRRKPNFDFNIVSFISTLYNPSILRTNLGFEFDWNPIKDMEGVYSVRNTETIVKNGSTSTVGFNFFAHRTDDGVNANRQVVMVVGASKENDQDISIDLQLKHHATDNSPKHEASEGTKVLFESSFVTRSGLTQLIGRLSTSDSTFSAANISTGKNDIDTFLLLTAHTQTSIGVNTRLSRHHRSASTHYNATTGQLNHHPNAGQYIFLR